MNKLHDDRRPTRATRASHAQSRRFTPRAAVAAERANSAGALSQFDPEKSQRGFAPPPGPVTAAAVAPQRLPAPPRAATRRWPPAPIWLGVAVAAIAGGAWGARQLVATPASQTLAASTVQASEIAAAPAAVEAPAPIQPPPAPETVRPQPPAPAAAQPRITSAPASRPPTITRRASAPVTAPPRPVATPAPPVRVVNEPGFRGSLTIASEPSGARVLLNGQPVGSTPLTLHGLPAGSRVVRIEADGYHPWSTAVRVVAEQETQVTATLRR